jgi:hypothetical protein
MQPARVVGAIIAVAAAASAQANDVRVPIDVGAFANTGPGTIYYDGAFGPYVRSEAVPGPDGWMHTRIEIDLAGIVAARDCGGFYGATVVDLGQNIYGPLSPGADIDLFAFENLGAPVDVSFLYEGPNPVHQGEPEALLARRVRCLDSFSGAQDAWDYTHVSLGLEGRLKALLSEPMPLIDLPADEKPTLLVSEAGSIEFFKVRILATIPAPASSALLVLAGIVGWRPRRRRR